MRVALRRRRPRFVVRTVALAVALACAAPAAAQALDAPELLYREGVSENEPIGPWRPLQGASISSLGFIVGTRSQTNGGSAADTVFRRLTMLAVPDGHPDQGSAFDPAVGCRQQGAPLGSEIVLGLGTFEGPGSYTAHLEAGTAATGANRTACSGGPETTATFTIDPAVAMSVLVKAPVLSSTNAFKELAGIATTLAGGRGETQCARDGVLQADGSIAGTPRTALLGTTVLAREIARTGHWACVGRLRSTYPDASGAMHATRWSPPVSFDATAAFHTAVSLPDNRRPTYTLAYAKMPPGSEGGIVTVRISSGRRCPKVAVKTLRARVGPLLRVRFRFTLPEKGKADLNTGRSGVDTYGWRFAFAFGGTKEITPARSTSFAAVLPGRFTYGGQLLFGQPTSSCIRTT